MAAQEKYNFDGMNINEADYENGVFAIPNAKNFAVIPPAVIFPLRR